jgi:hypothetical protein
VIFFFERTGGGGPYCKFYLNQRSTVRDEDWEVKSMRRFAQATMHFSRGHRCVGELFFYFSLIELDQLQQTLSLYPYLARPTVYNETPYPSPFSADSVFALRMQSMTAGAREQPRAHAVLCGEERKIVEKGSAGTRRAF